MTFETYKLIDCARPVKISTLPGRARHGSLSGKFITINMSGTDIENVEGTAVDCRRLILVAACLVVTGDGATGDCECGGGIHSGSRF